MQQFLIKIFIFENDALKYYVNLIFSKVEFFNLKIQIAVSGSYPVLN